ncbi:MAG: amidohydrolase family protein, partial [Planctomycetaceae bacterium]|nr:amidohydrolase family protein [Planctomycetaceae bacterium]
RNLVPPGWTPPGAGPAAWLRGLGFLDEPRLLAHGNHLEGEGIDAVRDSGSVVVHCPGSHAFFSHDRHPVAALAAAGIPVALGTDSLASHPDGVLSMTGEMRRLAVHPSGLQVFRQYYLFDGGRLPSYLAHLMGKEYEKDGKRGRTPDLCLLLLNHSKGTAPITVRVEVELVGYGERASRTATVAAGETAAVSLSPVFSPALYDLAEQKPGAIRLRVEGPDGKVIHEETERMTLLGRNDFFWRDGTGRSWVPALAAFVTPHDRARRVDALLRAARDHCTLGAMVGYQDVKGATREAVVVEQVRAVYDALAATGFSYVNAPFSVDARAQRIKYPSETLEDRGGNCIEAVLVFAAALEALGMRPCILVYEDHAQAAVAAWSDDPALIVLETTLCGRGPFEQALEQGERRFARARKEGKPPEVLDLPFWRAVGITPVPR